jgi:hypothetical protein
MSLARSVRRKDVNTVGADVTMVPSGDVPVTASLGPSDLEPYRSELQHRSSMDTFAT